MKYGRKLRTILQVARSGAIWQLKGGLDHGRYLCFLCVVLAGLHHAKIEDTQGSIEKIRRANVMIDVFQMTVFLLSVHEQFSGTMIRYGRPRKYVDLSRMPQDWQNQARGSATPEVSIGQSSTMAKHNRLNNYCTIEDCSS